MRPGNPRHGTDARVEVLESRQLLTGFVYSDLADTLRAFDPAPYADGNHGVIAAVGDVNADGVPDLLTTVYGFSSDRGGTRYETGDLTLLSGKDGSVLRRHNLVNSDYRNDQPLSLAGLGDIDGDGRPDYAAGVDSSIIRIYSGASGDQVRLIRVSDTIGVLGTVRISPMGDVNADGVPDLLASVHGAAAAVIYSGADGGVLRTFGGQALGLPGLGESILGSLDLNGDGITDAVMTAGPRVVAFSGADGSLIFNVDTGFGSDFIGLTPGPDLNADGVPEILAARAAPWDTASSFGPRIAQFAVLSGADGAHIRTISPSGTLPFSGSPVAIGDIDGDGTPDLAIGQVDVPEVFPNGTAGGRVLTYSGATGTLLGTIADHRRAGSALTSPGGYTSYPIGAVLTSADLTGDGVPDLVIGTERELFGFQSGFSHGPLIIADGRFLADPVFDGTATDPDGSLVAWGHIGVSGFLYRHGRSLELGEVPGFSAADQILAYSSTATSVLIVAAPSRHQAQAFAWYGSPTLQQIAKVSIPDAPRQSPPPGTFTFDRVVAAQGGQVLVQFTRDASTPSAWIFELDPAAGPPAGRLVYCFDGVPVAINSGHVVGISSSNPDDGIIWDSSATSTVAGFAPVAMNSNLQVLGGRTTAGGNEPWVFAFDGTPVRAVSTIAGGRDWRPVAFNDQSEVLGTYTTAAGTTSLFLSYLSDPGTAQPYLAVDPLAGQLFDGPADLAAFAPSVLGFLNRTDVSAPRDLFVELVHTTTGERRTADLSDTIPRGTFRVTSDASVAISDDGLVLVTRNAAGKLLLFTRTGPDQPWSRHDLTYTPISGSDPAPAYTTPHFGEIITWRTAGFTLPVIALATSDGLLLLEPFANAGGSTPEFYLLRNLTQEIAGSQPIARALVTMLPHYGLRLIGGLTASGDLVIYGETAGKTHTGQVAWSFANLYDLVVRPNSIVPPVFDDHLVAYVTPWDGLNFAGTFGGNVIVFWWAPGISSWQIANLTSGIENSQQGFGNFSNIQVYQTPWGGINIVGGNNLQIYWWTPGLLKWQAAMLTAPLGGFTGLNDVRSETMTTYVTPWGGLNIAALNARNELVVWWWTPGMAEWQRSLIDSSLSAPDRRVDRVGRLQSSVSATGEFSIFARTGFGELLRYSWSPQDPVWRTGFLEWVG